MLIDDARAHWRDRTAPCNIAQRARDEVFRWYNAHLYDGDHGRRLRGRLLSWANQVLHEIRCECPMCGEPIMWESGWVGGNRGQCPRHPNPYTDQIDRPAATP